MTWSDPANPQYRETILGAYPKRGCWEQEIAHEAFHRAMTNISRWRVGILDPQDAEYDWSSWFKDDVAAREATVEPYEKCITCAH
jgi:hypothetical protein